MGSHKAFDAQRIAQSLVILDAASAFGSGLALPHPHLQSTMSSVARCAVFTWTTARLIV